MSLPSLPVDTVIHGDCIEVMQGMPSASVDFILTDPPYLVRYRSRDGRSIRNDDNDRWLEPAFAEMYRLLKPGSFAVSFYGWNSADRFIAAWRAAGFRIVGHIVFCKRYASSVSVMRRHHEMAYLLAKGPVADLIDAIPDVLDWEYTHNKLHPTQKPVSVLRPLVGSFCKPGGLVLDPFCGAGSTLVAACETQRRYWGIEIDLMHCGTARLRLEAMLHHPRESTIDALADQSQPGLIFPKFSSLRTNAAR
jgi:site-specific DNA-methyltransferase (adenine-specific)